MSTLLKVRKADQKYLLWPKDIASEGAQGREGCDEEEIGLLGPCVEIWEHNNNNNKIHAFSSNLTVLMGNKVTK